MNQMAKCFFEGRMQFRNDGKLSYTKYRHPRPTVEVTKSRIKLQIPAEALIDVLRFDDHPPRSVTKMLLLYAADKFNAKNAAAELMDYPHRSTSCRRLTLKM